MAITTHKHNTFGNCGNIQSLHAFVQTETTAGKIKRPSNTTHDTNFTNTLASEWFSSLLPPLGCGVQFPFAIVSSDAPTVSHTTERQGEGKRQRTFGVVGDEHECQTN